MTERQVDSMERRERGRSSGARLASAQRALLVVGILLLGYSTLTTLDAMAYNRLQVDRFESLRSQAASAPSPVLLPGEDTSAAVAGPAEEGALIGTLRIPRIDLEVAVLEGTGSRTLQRGAGHIPGTAFPGAAGNAGLAGHRDGFFWGLQDLRVGDRIEIDTLTGSYAYVADAVEIVNPEDVRVLDYRPGRDLTLVTCYPFTYVGFAPLRYIVHARLVEPDPDVGDRVEAPGWRQAPGGPTR